MTKALVTGAGGAIGVHMLAHIMENTDWEVIGIDSFRHKGYYDRLSIVADEHPEWIPRISIVTHDLTAPFTPRQIDKLGGIDHIIHLASLSDVQASIDDPVPFVMNNTALQLNVLELARAIKPSTFICFSTDEVYGPAPKDSEGHPEWDVILPSNPYAASKAAQEALAIAWWRSYGVPVIITNTMNNFGEMQGHTKYPAMIQRKVMAGDTVIVHASSDGQIGTRYYLHSRNTADAVLFIIENIKPYLHTPGKIDRPHRFNIVGDRQMSNLGLAEVIADLMNQPLNYEFVDFHTKQPGHDLHYGLDGRKLAARGWKSPIGFEESMKQTIEWQCRHPEWMK